jgi:anti-sigma-K factor RskA
MAALPEARESLSYWETRLQTLPRRAVRQRREARAMAERWRERVCDAERVQYGAGVLGALLLLFAERRLPTETRYASRRVARVVSRAALAAFVALAAVLVVAGVVVIELFAAIVRAL